MSNTARVYRLGQHSPLEISNIDELRDGDVVKYISQRRNYVPHQLVRRTWDFIMVAQRLPFGRDNTDIVVTAYPVNSTVISSTGDIIGLPDRERINRVYYQSSHELWAKLNDDLQNASALVESIDGGKK